MFVAATVSDTTTPAARPIAINRTEGNSNLGISALIGDATTIFIAGIARDRAVGQCEHAAIVDTATVRSGIPRNCAVGQCECAASENAPTIPRGLIARNGAVGHREHARLEIEDATTAGIACAEIAHNGAVDECKCARIGDAAALRVAGAVTEGNIT